MDHDPIGIAAPSAAERFGLMIFTRYPVPGQTKTRLIPRLGAEGAAALQQSMTEYVLAQVIGAAQRLPLAVEVHFAGGSQDKMIAWLGATHRGQTIAYLPQSDGALGARLIAAFRLNFEQGRPGAIAIGSDCPALGADHLATALAALTQVDVVLGPATDGGYYLIGLRQSQPALFEAIAWGTEQVLEQTLAVAARQGLTVELLSPLTDVDRPEDLPHWEQIATAI